MTPTPPHMHAHVCMGSCQILITLKATEKVPYALAKEDKVSAGGAATFKTLCAQMDSAKSTHVWIAACFKRRVPD